MSQWIVLANGAEHYLSGIDAAHNHFCPDTLAHHLAQINRFTGATQRPYSVAEHSLLCADIAEHLGLPLVVQLACLVHDYHKAITGDCSYPAKLAVGHAWDAFEQPIVRALHRQLGLLSTFTAWRQRIKAVDLVAQATERRDLLAYGPANRTWPILDTPGQEVAPFDAYTLNTMKREQTHWTEWRDELRTRFNTLSERAKEEHAARMHSTAEAA
jgi:5'-deoxynucleotidase YfbR-like HD superfamily hydrolase